MPTAAVADHFRGIATRYGRVRDLDVCAVRRIAIHHLGLEGFLAEAARVRVRAAAWRQFTSLPALVRQARARHYSRFRFYEPAEFAHALATFAERLRRRYRFLWAIAVRNNHTIALASRRA